MTLKPKLEKILLTEGQSFATEDVVGPVIDCVFHAHPQFELTYVASSRGTRFAGAEIGVFEQGMLSLYGPMLPHHYLSSPADSLSPTWGHARVVKFDRAPAGIPLFRLPELARVEKMLDAAAKGLDFSRKAAEKAEPLIDSLFKAQGASRIALLMELLDLLSRSEWKQIALGFETPENFQTDARINAVLAKIHARVEANKPLPLKDAAKAAAMSPEAFSRLFSRMTRMSFIDYIIELRLARAELRLMNSNDTIAEICYESGFNNLSNFNRQFAKRKGMTPLRYRKSFGKL